MKRCAALAVAALALGEGSLAATPGGWATLEVVGHKAQSRAAKEPWTPVAAGAVLAADDALRTLERSSAAARLDGGGRIILTELTTLTLRTARSLAVDAGQVDVEVPAGGPPMEVEAGGARISIGGGEGPSLVRLRLRDKALQVMVLAGKARVTTSGGAADEVPAGYGIGLGSSPKPEKLLPAPVTSAPAPGSAPDHANPRLWWEDVPGATGYTVEVCHDQACGGLEDRAVAVIGAPWAPEGLPLGELYWRVAAVSASGLDGMPSRAVRFTIRSLWRKPYPRPPSSP